MADSNLYTVLSGLNTTDAKLWKKIKGLSGDLSTATSNLTTLIGTTSGVLDTRITTEVGTLNTTIETVSGALNDKIDEQVGTLNTTIETVSGNLKKYTDNSIEDLSGTVSGALEQLTVGAATYQLSAINATEGFAASYQLMETKNGATAPVANSIINIPKDQFLSGATYNATTETIDLTFAVSGVPNLTSIPVGDLVHEYVGASGVTVTSIVNGNSTIAGVVDPASESFLTVGANGFKLAGVQDAIDAVSGAADTRLDALEAILAGFAGSTVKATTDDLDSRLDTAESDIDNLEAALEGYTGAKAVSAEFAAVDGRLDDLEAATTGGLSGVAANTNIIIGTGTAEQVKSSDYALGTGTFKASPDATTVATEAGVAGHVTTKIEAAVNAAADKIVLGNDAHSTKDSGVGIKAQGTGTAVSMDATSDTEVPTSKAIATYVNDGLTGLLNDINDLNTEIGD